MSSEDKTSTTGTITEVKEFLEEDIPEKEHQDVDNIGENKDLTGINGIEKSKDITLEINIEETINAETEEHRQVTLEDTTKLIIEPEGTTNTETEDIKKSENLNL